MLDICSYGLKLFTHLNKNKTILFLFFFNFFIFDECPHKIDYVVSQLVFERFDERLTVRLLYVRKLKGEVRNYWLEPEERILIISQHNFHRIWKTVARIS